MKKIIKIMSVLSLSLLAGLTFLFANSYANEEVNTTGTSVSIAPRNKILPISSGTTYDDTIEIKNDGPEKIKVDIYATPYFYTHSEANDLYTLGFNTENNFTQMSRWITFSNDAGEYTEKASFEVNANESLKVSYRITTPENIPAGGQYCAIFAHVVPSAPTEESGIRTEISPGMVIYGHSTEGENIFEATISDLKIKREPNQNTKNKNIFASAKVKNSGNIDFIAKGTLKINSIIGFKNYETPANAGVASIIPESELIVSDEWTETPSFGIYKATWTVTTGTTQINAAEESTETIERIIFLCPVWFIILTIILLTILIIGIIIRYKQRKIRRSRLTA